MTGVTKAMVCSIHVVEAAGFFSDYLSGPLPYVRCYITFPSLNILSASLTRYNFKISKRVSK